MADIIARLQVDSSQYDGKLKTAIEQMTKMEQEVRRTGATFAYADKAELEFVKSLGSLESSSTSARTKLMEYTNAIASLTATYRAMTDEEKKSDFGQGLAASIDQIKAKAAELKDIMSDTNIELKNLASDTNFTDGLNLMTRTVGSCAAAITAWTGDSKEMEAVIKDLAKIGTTVAAVEQLTKAVQKQNLVMLKNPYVAAAAAVVALGVAIGKLIKKSQELSAVDKALQDVQQKGRENSAKEITRIDTLNNILHDNTRSLEERKTALAEIQNLVPDYHGALTEEGNLINDNTGAIDDYIDSLQRAAIAQAAFDKMVELQKKKMEEQVKLQKAQAELERAQSMASTAVPTAATGGAGAISMAGATAGVRQGEVRAAQNEVNSIQKIIDEQDAQINALRDLVKSNDIGTTGATKTTTGGTVKVKAEIELPEGSLAKLQDDLKKAQENFRMATDDPGRVAAKKEIDEITEAIKRMTAEEQNAAADGSIAAMRQKLQQLTEEWENAADPTTREELKKQIMEVSDTLSQMEGNNKKATSALSMWGDHQAKIEETMNLLRQFQTMMDDPNIGEGQRKWAEEMAKSYEEQLKKMMGDTDQAVATMQDSLNSLSSGVGAISTLGNAFNDLKGIGEDLASAFSGEMDAWDSLMTVFNSGIGILETVMGVMEAINTLQEISSVLSKKKIADQAAETTAVVTGKSAESTANLTEAGTSLTAAGASAAESSAAAGKAVAGIPIVGPILAVAAIAAVLGAAIAAIAKSKSAGSFATGGLIMGNSYSGDNLTANVNSGELILSRSQQASIAGQLTNSNPLGNLNLGLRVEGTQLLVLLNNVNRSKGGSRNFYSKVH